MDGCMMDGWIDSQTDIHRNIIEWVETDWECKNKQNNISTYGHIS